jgi:Na+/melibiose symporter-like transporter
LSIRVAAGALPAAAFLAAGAVMLAYPLTETAFRRMIAEMAERRAAAVDDTEQLTPALRTDEPHGRAATDGN